MKRKIGIIALIIVVLVLLFSWHAWNSSMEKPNEMADLQGMFGAELTAKTIWKDKLPEAPVEYWYDPDEFDLIPVSEPKPKSFGLGTGGAGGATEEFEADTDSSYEYDEGTDYTNKVIHVTARNKDGKLDVKVDWVDAD